MGQTKEKTRRDGWRPSPFAVALCGRIIGELKKAGLEDPDEIQSALETVIELLPNRYNGQHEEEATA